MLPFSPSLTCSSLAVFQQVSGLLFVCLGERREGNWPGNHEHPSVLGVTSPGSPVGMLGGAAGLPSGCLGAVVFSVAEVLLSQ